MRLPSLISLVLLAAAQCGKRKKRAKKKREPPPHTHPFSSLSNPIRPALTAPDLSERTGAALAGAPAAAPASAPALIFPEPAADVAPLEPLMEGETEEEAKQRFGG